MKKISATIITLNEEERIEVCLKSLSWADEIVVVDSGSTDSTVSICKRYTDKVVIKDNWEGYGRQKNICAELASNDWIFNIDADETVSEELKREITGLSSNALSSYDAYKVARKNFFNNVWIRHGGWYPDYITRLYNKKRCRFSDSIVHEAVTGGSSYKNLKGWLNHYTYQNLTEYFTRLDKYSSLAAEEMLKKGRRFRWHDLILRPPFNFLKNYIIKLGFLDGCYGIIVAYGYSRYSFKKYEGLKKLGS